MENLDCLCYCEIISLNDKNDHGQKKFIKVRARVNHLYYHAGWSKNRISRALGMSKHFVIQWTQSPEQDFSHDERGWPRGQRRKWSELTEERIRHIHHQLTHDPRQYYWGATAITQHWRKQYADAPPPLRTIGQILKDLDLSKPRKSPRQPGAAKYLCYPEHTLYAGKLGDRVMEADFIVRRYIKGKSNQLQFVGFAAKQQPRIRYYAMPP